MRKSSWLRRGILGSLAGLCLTGMVHAQSRSESTINSFSPDVLVTAKAEPPGLLERLFSWLPFFGSSSSTSSGGQQLSTTTRVGQMSGGYNGMSPGDMMGTRPLQGTVVGRYRPIQ